MAITSASANTVSAQTNQLKVDYKIDELMLQIFNNYSLVYNMFRKSNETLQVDSTGGLQFSLPLMLSGEAGTAVRGDMKLFMNAQNMTWGQMTGKLFPMYTAFRWSGLADKLTRDRKYAYYNTRAIVLKQAPKDHAKTKGQMFYRDGSGALARLNGDPSGGTTNTVYGNHVTSSGYTFGTQHLRPNMPISYWNDATKGTTRGKGFLQTEKWLSSDNKVSSVTSSTVFESSASVNNEVTTGDYITIQVNDDSTNGESPGINDNLGTNGLQLEYSGIGLHLSTNTGTVVHGINKSNSYWQPATVVGSEGSSTAFSWNTHVLAPMRAVSNKLGADRADDMKCLCSPAMQDRISIEFDGTIRAGMAEYKKTYGYDTISARRAGVKVDFVADVDAPEGALLFLDPRVLRWMEAMPPSILNGDGLEERLVTGYNAYEGVYWSYDELLCTNPNGLAAVYGLSTT